MSENFAPAKVGTEVKLFARYSLVFPRCSLLFARYFLLVARYFLLVVCYFLLVSQQEIMKDVF